MAACIGTCDNIRLVTWQRSLRMHVWIACVQKVSNIHKKKNPNYVHTVESGTVPKHCAMPA